MLRGRAFRQKRRESRRLVFRSCSRFALRRLFEPLHRIGTADRALGDRPGARRSRSSQPRRRDLKRARLNYPDLKRKVIDQATLHRADRIIIEDSGSGTALIQDLARERYSGIPKPTAFRPEGSKVTRMNAESDKIANGQVFLPRDARWLEDLRLELLQFPYGRHDDQVDSISQFLNWVSLRKRNRVRIIHYPFG